MKRFLPLVLSLSVSFGAAAFDEDDFHSGVFILNEDWYGHQNSTINMWYPDNTDDIYNPVYYRIFQYKNPGRELGCTSQYAQIFGNRMYIMSKQHQDPGASVAGGRLTIVDASTFKYIKHLEVINPKGTATFEGSDAGGMIVGKALGDGRSCCGVTPDKMYLGTSNGIFVYDINADAVTGFIEGTQNPLMTGNENNIDGQGPLYQNQIGSMIRTQDYVFAIMQDRGVLVIDPVADEIVSEIPGCFSTMVQSADGAIWVGENIADPNKTNAFGVSYTHYPYGDNGSEWKGNGLMRIDPYTLETKRIILKLEGAGIPQSWYAWTAGKLAASAKRNVLYFTYIDPAAGQAAWFSDSKLFRYDIDKDETKMIYDSSFENLWFYSSSLRVDPVTDKLYAFFYVGNNIASKNWVYIRFNDKGDSIEEEKSARLISNYWYPALYIFPDYQHPEIVDMPSVITLNANETTTIDLRDKVVDKDTPVFTIVKRIKDNSNPDVVSAAIVKGQLQLTPGEESGESYITVQFDSNGLTTDWTIEVKSPGSTCFPSVVAESIKTYIDENRLTITGLNEGEAVSIWDIQGRMIGTSTACNGCAMFENLPSGMLVLKSGIRERRFAKKIFIH